MIAGDGGGADARLGADITGCRHAHRRLLETVGALTADGVGRPSRLPGWTVGHVLTHVARNADSHAGMLARAARGEIGDQYPRGRDQRAEEIEAGARRAAGELVADVAVATARLEEIWEATPSAVWRTGKGRTVAAGEIPVAELPFRRWRETEIHHADLGLGFGVDDWPAAYVDRELPLQLGQLVDRVPEGTPIHLQATDTGERWTVPPGTPTPSVIAAPRRRILAWLVGRSELPGAPSLGPWS